MEDSLPTSTILISMTQNLRINFNRAEENIVLEIIMLKYSGGMQVPSTCYAMPLLPWHPFPRIYKHVLLP